MRAQPVCPKCGFVMCEQFNTVKTFTHPATEKMPVLTKEYIEPNGKYICYHCKIEVGAL